MEEVEGKKVIDKYVTPVKESKRETTHVGGPLPKKDDPVDKLRMNKLGLDSARDY